MKTSELRPCPFCGGEGKYQKYDIWHTVECKECRAVAAVYKTREEAITAWNRRTGKIIR
ncbi:MAG: Lar family restriction alleviation protein [Oscillospiraceae bacterium]|nr:Lar family restriction alleviation protein [Oscillospiraceae bacterium]